MTDRWARAAVGHAHALAHVDSAVTVERIAFNHLCFDALAPKDVREAFHHRGGSRPGRSGHGDNGMLGGHDVCLPRICACNAQSRASSPLPSLGPQRRLGGMTLTAL